jgi:hypothetical protein
MGHVYVLGHLGLGFSSRKEEKKIRGKKMKDMNVPERRRSGLFYARRHLLPIIACKFSSSSIVRRDLALDKKKKHVAMPICIYLRPIK